MPSTKVAVGAAAALVVAAAVAFALTQRSSASSSSSSSSSCGGAAQAAKTSAAGAAPDAPASSSSSKPAIQLPSSPAQFTAEHVEELLTRLIRQQRDTFVDMRRVADRVFAGEVAADVESVYRELEHLAHADPFRDAGLSYSDFDSLLDRFQSEPRVKDLVTRMIAGDQDDSTEVQDISDEKLLEMHYAMLESLAGYERQLKHDGPRGRAAKTLTFSVQLLVGVKCREQFGVSTSELDAVIKRKGSSLRTNGEFLNVNQQISALLNAVYELA